MNQMESTRFHDDLRAAVVAGVPLKIGERESKLLTLAKIDQLENQISPKLSTGNAIDERTRQQFFDSLTEFPLRYRAAIQVFDRLGSMTPVLDGLTAQILAERRVAGTLRWSFSYLLLLLLLAASGLSLFLVWVVPAIESMRADLLLPAAIDAPPRLDLIQWLPGVIVAFSFCFGLLVVWLLTGGVAKVAMWLGGRHFVRCQTSKTTLRTLNALVDSGMPIDLAVSTGCDLTGADAIIRRDIQSSAPAAISPAQLQTLTNYLTISANQRLTSMSAAAPIALVATVGGVIGLIYCVSIFWPMIAMIKDMATVGT